MYYWLQLNILFRQLQWLSLYILYYMNFWGIDSSEKVEILELIKFDHSNISHILWHFVPWCSLLIVTVDYSLVLHYDSNIGF